MSRGYDLGYEMEFDKQGALPSDMSGEARKKYEELLDTLHGAALEAFEEAVERGREQAKSDLLAESDYRPPNPGAAPGG